jgi:BirA family biotin operon repressor/biotin-[acetyl-CoA-carboxylase] ligase
LKRSENLELSPCVINMSDNVEIKQEIICALHDASPDYVSGEELSRKLSISRAAIWKHVIALKQMRYEIESVRSQGYRLLNAPDLLFPWEIQRGLNNKFIGSDIKYFSCLDSSNETAYQLGLSGAAEGTAVIAEAQSKGKGRLGRTWESPAEKNLYLSVILRPAIPLGEAPQISLIAAVAACQAVDRFKPGLAAIKWPNDIWINGLKVAGILTELRGEAGHVDFIVVGIGVNLNMNAEDFPEILSGLATSLKIATGDPVDRAGFTRFLLQDLETWYVKFLDEGFGSIRDEWERHSLLSHKNVKISIQNKIIEGRAEGLDESGLLIINTTEGEKIHVPAGDVTVLK